MYNVIGMVLNFAYFFIIALASNNTDLPIPKFFHFINIILFLNILLVYFVASKFITRERNEFTTDEDSSEWFRAIVSKTGEITIIDKSLWIKGEVYFVNYNRFRWNEGSYSFTAEIKARYKNSNMRVPVGINLELEGSLDRKEIFEALYNFHLTKNEEGDTLSLSSYIEHTFEKFNEQFQPYFDELIGKYAIMEISQPYLLDSIIDNIIFPERIFSNVKNVKLCLGDPTFSSCKGMVDCLN